MTTKNCPFCDELLDSVARVCPHCDEDLSAELDVDLSMAIEGETREDAAAGRFDPGTAAAFRRVRPVTIVLASILGACLLAIAVGWSRPASATSVIAWITAVVVVVPALLAGVRDLALRSPEQLTTPRSVYETYVKCLRERRWAYALSLVVPRGRQGERRRPALPSIRMHGEICRVDTPEGLASFWKPLLHTRGFDARSFSSGAVHVEETGPDTAIAGSVLRASLSNLVLRTSAEIPVDMSLMRVDDRWYLVDAVPTLTANQGAGTPPPPDAPAQESKECAYCGMTVRWKARKCRHCREILCPDLRDARERQGRGGDAGVGRDALVYGILGLFLCQVVFGPLAVVKGLESRRRGIDPGLGTAGLVLGILACLLVVAWLVAVVAGGLF